MRKFIPILIGLVILIYSLTALAAPPKGISVAKVTGTDVGTNISFTNPYPPHNTMNVFAGTFAGTIDSNTASFYCTDLAHYLALFPPHTYADSGTAGSYISYILKNFYPNKAYSYPGALGTVQKEAAAVQCAIWIFSDNLNYSTISDPQIRDRAKEIEDIALMNAGVTQPPQTLQIVPISILNYCDVKDTIKVKVLDQLGNPVSGTIVSLSITSGSLSATTVTTGAGGLTPPIIITKGTDTNATLSAVAKVQMPAGILYIHGSDPANNQKLVCAKNCFGYQKKTIMISCTATSPGSGGGVESTYNMADALFQRHIRIMNGETSPMISNQDNVFPITYPLNNMVPLNGPFNTGGTVVTPFDILSISNATSAYAVDYKYGNGQRVGTIFSTTSNSAIYSHSKVVCDRLSGSELRSITIENWDSREFYIAELANYKNHTVDYSISFSVYETPNGLIVDNKWTIPEYIAPAGTTNVYNFQCWGANPSMAVELVKKVLAKFEAAGTVTYSQVPLKNPDVYIKTAKYTNDGKVTYTFNNTTAFALTVPFTFVVTPQQGMTPNTVNQNVTIGAGVSSVTMNSLGYMSSASVNMLNSTGFKDAVFLGGGVYGAFSGGSATIGQFSSILTTGTPSVTPSSLVFTGGARLTGSLGNGKLYIARSLDASYAGIDLRNFTKLRFEVSGQGVMAVYLEVMVNGVYKYPFVNIPISNSFTTKEVNLNQFLVDGQPVDLSQVSMVSFQIDKGMNASLTNLDFSVKNTVMLAGSVGIGTTSGTVKEFNLSQNYPNPFNPVTRITYSIPKQELVMIRVYDVLGKEVAQLVNEVKPSGIYEVSFDASSFSSGVYFYKLETSSFSDVKRMIVTK